jgi:hypothetical protein
MLAVIIGLLLGLLICFIWWVWASTSYRFSDSRIRMLLSDLYLKYLGQTLEPTQVSKVISYQVFPQVVTMVGHVIDAKTREVLYKHELVFKINDFCRLTDVTCIVV